MGHARQKVVSPDIPALNPHVQTKLDKGDIMDIFLASDDLDVCDEGCDCLEPDNEDESVIEPQWDGSPNKPQF